MFSSADEIVFGPKLSSCHFLRACLDETLRMSPPAGGPLWRVVEPGGATIDGDYVPAGCEVGAGIYAMHHNPRNWPSAANYMPERWLEKEGKDEDGSTVKGDTRQPYFPFNIGSRSCIGKPLALAQIMLTFAHILWKFELRRVDATEDWLSVDDSDTPPPEYMLKEHVTGQKTGPFLRFRARA